MLKITQIKSVIKSLSSHRKTMRTLGLRKIGQTVIHQDTPQIRGMVHSISHLVRCEPVSEKPAATPRVKKAGYKVVKAKKA